MKARDFLAKQHFAEAKAALEKLRLQSLNPYERALVFRIHAAVAFGLGNSSEALGYLEKTRAENAFPAADQADVLFQIAQLQSAIGQWQSVIETLATWFQTVENPNSVGYFLMAVAHYQLEDLDAALAPAQQAVEIAENPQQAWLQLLLTIHLTRKEYAEATPVLVDLITRYPDSDKAYWFQLSSLYGVQEDIERALAVLELAYHKGLLSEDGDLRRLAQLMLFQQLPQRAAGILEKSIANGAIEANAEAYELLSNSWILARAPKRAEESLQRAAELAPTGNLYVRLAKVHLLQEEWDESATALQQALVKGSLDDRENVHMLLGMSYFSAGRIDEARGWFERPQPTDATRQQAETWLAHIDRELESKRSVDQVLR